MILTRALKKIKTLESLNLSNNLLAGESSDALLFLVKENRSITKCLADNNMIKAHSLAEIERTCKSNKAITTQIDLPEIRKEIKGLRKQRADQGLYLEDLPKIKAHIEQQKRDIAVKLVEMTEVEDRIAGARNEMGKEIQSL